MYCFDQNQNGASNLKPAFHFEIAVWSGFARVKAILTCEKMSARSLCLAFRVALTRVSKETSGKRRRHGIARKKERKPGSLRSSTYATVEILSARVRRERILDGTAILALEEYR